MENFPDFIHLRYVLEVAEQKNFTLAAQKLRVDQSSLSRHVKTFQSHFRFSLFEKTKSGRLELARELLAAREETISALRSIKVYKPSVFRIGCSSLVAPEICSFAGELYRQLTASSEIRPTLGDTVQLLEKLQTDVIDAAILTRPIDDPSLRVIDISQDSLVVCLPETHRLARNAAIAPDDLQGMLTIFRQPSQHPAAHDRLVKMLRDVGIATQDHSQTSHPTETMKLVKEGYGFALVREGTAMESGLVTKRIMGIDWTVDTVMVFKIDSALRSLPLVARSLKRKFGANGGSVVPKKKPETVDVKRNSIQKDLFG
jgi:DNA-binding transcriptional LysR family regulator